MNCLQITPDKQFIAAAGNPHVRLFEVGGNANPNPVSERVRVCVDGLVTSSLLTFGVSTFGRPLRS